MSERGREARWHVASQLAAEIVQFDRTGSTELLAFRIRGLADARRTGDSTVMRSALMDLGTAVGACVAQIDMSNPGEGPPSPKMILELDGADSDARLPARQSPERRRAG